MEGLSGHGFGTEGFFWSEYLSQILDQTREPFGSRFEIGDGNEFVGGVGLVDGAGADADGGKAGVVEVGGIGKPRGSDQLAAGLSLGELLQPRVVDGHVHGGSFAGLSDGEGEFVLVDELLQKFFGSSGLLEVGGEADVEGGLGVVGHDIGAAASGDGADVEGGVPEDGVGVGREAIGELAIEEIEASG